MRTASLFCASVDLYLNVVRSLDKNSHAALSEDIRRRAVMDAARENADRLR